MGKLTNAQAGLLQDMFGSGAKTGNFWLDLGNPIQTLLSLERRGLVECTNYNVRAARSQYRITQAGRTALTEGSET